MTDELSMGLERLLRKAEIEKDVDFLRQGVQLLSHALMEIEFEQHLGAGHHERTPERSGYRNGYREREWETRVGKIDLKVPRARDSSFYPSLLPAAPEGRAGAHRQWSRRPMSTGSGPGRSTPWSRRSG